MLELTESERLLRQAARDIERRDAEILLAHAWQLTRAQLLVMDGPVPAAVAQRFAADCARRATGVPIAYLLGQREFWSLQFAVTPAVLVPRPETELLVERVLHLVAAPAAEIADLGTGSGAIAIALAHERPGWRVLGTELSAEALEVARRNGELLVGGRVAWLRGDWFAPLENRRFDAIASNPPYIAAHDPALRSDGLKAEPRTALTPEGDGTAALLTLINGAPGRLKPGGWLVLEHGNSQAQTLRHALVARGFTHVTSHRDLAGHERVTEGQWPQEDSRVTSV
jgi:release factor glutamine methyltransferase